MERKVGEIFTCDGKTYLIVSREKEDCCIGCAFDLGEYACKNLEMNLEIILGTVIFDLEKIRKALYLKK